MGSRAAAQRKFEFPSLGDDTWVRRDYWQLLLPPEEHVLVPPSQWTGEFAWDWNHFYYGRQPVLDQTDLERWVGLPNPGGTPASAGMNVYLFSSLGRIGPAEIVTAGRSTIVFVASGIALLAGLLLIYVRAARHPVVLLAAAAILAGLTAVQPELAVLAAQASAVGLALVLLAVFLRRLTAGLSQGPRAAACRNRGCHGADCPRRAQRSGSFRRRRERFLPHGDRAPDPGGGAMSREGREQKRPRRACKVQSANLQLKIRNRQFAIELSPFLFGAHPLALARARCTLQLAFLLMVLLAITSACPAATPPPAENAAESGELRFRRVYFPEGTQAWPQGREKYLPIDAAEFERLLAAVQHTTTGAPPQATVGFVAAQYEARLKGQTLQGSATLDVSPSIASAMLMNLDPCNLAIARAQWVTSDGAPAILGLAGDGKLQLLAERGGQMKLDWSLAGQMDAAGGVNFAIALPPSPVNRMLVELPAGWTPTVDRGIVSDEGPVDGDFHRFRLDLGGRPGCRLRLAKAGSMEVRPQAVLASQATTYDFSLRGVELSVKLSIEAHREPLRRVALGLDPALELIEVSASGAPLAWSMANQADKSRQATIEIPAALQEGAAKLQLRAIAPLTMNGSWKLPRMDVAGIVLRSNTIRLAVPLPLCIERLETRACRQTGVSPLTGYPVLGVVAGEQLDFTALAANAAIEVSLSQRAAQIQALSATATLLGQGKMSSRVAIDFHTGEGPVFALEANVLPSWTIDSVESQPTDGLDDWTLEGGRGNSQKLTVRLARPLTAARPLRLIVAARRLYAVPGRNLGIDDLVPLRFNGLAQSKRLVDLYASGSNELRFTAGEHLQRVDAKDLTAAELDLFAEPPGDLLFLDDAAGARTPGRRDCDSPWRAAGRPTRRRSGSRRWPGAAT